MKPFSVLFLIFIFYHFVGAVEISETFDTTATRGEISELIWNTLSGDLEPPIHIFNFNNGSGLESKNIDPGDGRHGVFDISTYANFSENGDVSSNVIRINTDQYPILYFKSFDLQATWRIRPTGTQPLVIKVLGDMQIDGEIDCSGEDGEGISATLTDLPLGGTGVCGGGKGGNGGNLVTPPTNGDPGGVDLIGGGAGPSIDLLKGQGGGGGGAYTDNLFTEVQDPTDGDDSAAGVGGLKGIQVADNAFRIVGGGSGGGGGSTFSNATLGEDSVGAGGGAGGGIINIVVLGDVNISATGKVLANGGAGGGDNGTLRAGGGGGGGGGSISIFTPKNITVDGVVEAKAGAGGLTNAANGGDGGGGSSGRTWLLDADALLGGGGDANVEPDAELASSGFVRYKTGEFVSESISYDLNNSHPLINSAILSADLLSDVTLQLAFSNSNNFSAPTWETFEGLSQVPSRYMRFRITLNNQSALNPNKVSAVTINYSPFTEDDFEFTGACGKVESHPPNQFIFTILLLLLLPILLILGLRRFV
ncbi:MAG: hypothetical protein KDD58_13800 [Bdellovibrionales bacterium]|nr:hypothetical protein [Bdellovibrionales bacterium]